MVTVFASILFALPTSLVVCLTRGFGLLQCSTVVLVVLIAIPTIATFGILLVQACRTPQRYARRAVCELRFHEAAAWQDGPKLRWPALERV